MAYGLTNKTYIRVFKNPKVLQEMLDLYMSGWSSVSLGKKYRCDHTSILHQIRRSGLKVPHRIRVIRQEKTKVEAIYYPLPKPATPGKYDHLLLEDINRGKTYKQYRLEAENKKHAISTKVKGLELQSVEIREVRF